ncbi:PEP-CTERM sorting domain-containing protein [Rhodoferax sp.]|uniref:PEP-CTERM sorting domain-containing protein n=1 Tax=Rhodoferax sp. TaxID=50421 RepID=UPI0025F818A5|nr:PEP-CTERM sorting domain-containing protein [Rhodoferax sp.]
MSFFSLKTCAAALLVFSGLTAQATSVTVLSKPNTFDTIYGVNFGTGSSYHTSFLGGVTADFSALVEKNSTYTPGKFTFKNPQDGYQGVGVSPKSGGERTPGEIDIGEVIKGSFSQAVQVKSFSLGLLFNGPEYDDVKEKAIVSVVYADNSKASFSLIASGDTTATWSTGGVTVNNLSPATYGMGGAWSVLNPFGNKLVKSIAFGAATGEKGLGKGTNQSDYTLMSITAAVPEPETYAMLLAGLAAIGAVARRKKKA